MTTKRLTDAFVRGVTAPGRYGDGGRGSFGLSLLVKESKGGLLKNWQRRCLKKDGKPTSRGLGVYPSVTLDQARQLAFYYAHEGKPAVVRAILGATDEQLAERMAPVRHAVEASVTFAPPTAMVEVDRELRLPTFRWIFLESLEHRSRGFKKSSKTAAQAKSLFDTYIPPNIADRPIEDVTSGDLVDCLAVVWREKPATAKKIVQHLQGTFNHAIAKDLIDADPLAKAKIGLGKLKPSGKNHDALPHREVGAAIQAIRKTSALASTKLAFEYLVLTASRSGEVRLADWSEIDWSNRTWTVPSIRMKSGREHRVPLSDRAIAVLNEAWGLSDGKGLIFPSATGKVLSDNTLSKLLRENNIPAVPHGCRSSFRDFAAELTDFPSEIVEHALAHVEGSATVRAYRRTDYFDKRRVLMEQWGTYVDALPF